MDRVFVGERYLERYVGILFGTKVGWRIIHKGVTANALMWNRQQLFVNVL